MSKIIIAILVSLAFVSCRNSNNAMPIHKQQIAPIKTNNNKNYSPLFLGLNPYMSEYEFSKEISNLNSQSKLNNGKFTIPIKIKSSILKLKKQKTL